MPQFSEIQESVVQIYDSTLLADAASFDVQNIPGIYINLRVLLSGRGSDAATAVSVQVRFNNDSGTNYDYQQSRSMDAVHFASETFAATSFFVGEIAADTGDASSSGQVIIEVVNYTGTTFHKNITMMAFALKVTTQMAVHIQGGRWRNTAAVNRITVFPAVGNFRAGTRLTITGTN